MAAYALTWMPAVLRAAGLKVEEVGDWRNHGHGNVSDIRGVLLHHTAGPASGNYPSQGVVTNGRTGLPGPLCNLGLARDGTWKIIAAGLGYHAGAGYVSWCGRDNGNNHLIGVEAESTGRGDWTSAQLEAYPRGVAALLRHLGLGPDRALAHKEWAPGRKIDPAGWPGDMAEFRSSVAEWMAGKTPEEGFLMALAEWKQDRMFDWMSELMMGMPGRNFNGRQFDFQQGQHAQLVALIQGQGALLTKLVDGDDITPEKLRDAFAEALAEQREALAAEIGAQAAQKLRPELLELIGADNTDQAEKIISLIAASLSSPRPAS